ncbi:hypothetical protein BGZ70_005855 [Mortierella alpina]|uniref:Calcineurin-like phosphoesterase domain-containing protein n=1 Tax=Mortierella alpina TaxID=64518 RepID=A0A9P6J8H0_MORAP|nr:hypothetical protein BGZ70_005855 [Mortierella alpina]
MPRFQSIFALALLCLHMTAGGQTEAAPLAVSGRIVAIGDLHSDYSQAVAVLRMANILDSDDNWAGGQDTLISTGDIVDRGPDTIVLYRLFEKIRQQAKAAGGEVVNVYGNHEVMNIGGDWRYVTSEDIASFGGKTKRKAAWDIKTGWLGKFVYSNFNITHVQHGHTVFSHGDMHPDWAKLGVDKLNTMAREALWKGDYKAPIFRTPGPIWDRSLAKEEDGTDGTCQTVEAIKKMLGVKRLVSGHTAQDDTGKILSLCGGSYLGIDVGISSYYGSNKAALEIIENADGTQTVSAIYASGKTPL